MQVLDARLLLGRRLRQGLGSQLARGQNAAVSISPKICQDRETGGQANAGRKQSELQQQLSSTCLLFPWQKVDQGTASTTTNA
jgi:hypothetical protein